MRIEHKNSGEVINEFPSYVKLNGIYGMVILSHLNTVHFIFYDDSNGLMSHDVTQYYKVINECDLCGTDCSIDDTICVKCDTQ